MPSLSTILVFLAASIGLLLIPGPVVVYLVTRSVSQGRRAGLISLVGVHLATAVYVLLTTLGLATLLTASPTAFAVVQYLGVGYLIWLGARKLWNARANRVDDVDAPLPRESLPRVLRDGFAVNILSPKSLIFFTAFLPQFVDTGRGPASFQLLFFGALFTAVAVLSDGTYTLVSSALAGRLRRSPTVQRHLDRSSGIIYLLLGAFTALLSPS
ncbi:LysE family translocator [Streptomyces iconiensis]|uniref:LysE family translocator n=1 Tax=Streptomyces iconiensis TaxID=1384038 RepID=A0ABT7A647_9ACTN|nr:LysE family translocator [Streptomyces iconiensis]MDJ1136810.1 LysE family translocator [Streptomyces iconiensis]